MVLQPEFWKQSHVVCWNRHTQRLDNSMQYSTVYGINKITHKNYSSEWFSLPSEELLRRLRVDIPWKHLCHIWSATHSLKCLHQIFIGVGLEKELGRKQVQVTQLFTWVLIYVSIVRLIGYKITNWEKWTTKCYTQCFFWQYYSVYDKSPYTWSTYWRNV